MLKKFSMNSGTQYLALVTEANNSDRDSNDISWLPLEICQSLVMDVDFIVKLKSGRP